MNASPAPGRTNEAARVYLIDASVYVFRAWFSLPDTMVDGDGQPINAVHGFARFLGDVRRRVEPDSVLAVAFDESLTSSFRNAIYPPYKANRPPAPVELTEQFRRCQQLCRGLGLPTCAHAEYEADDIIGHWAREARESGARVTVISRDKDLTQLIGDGDQWWDFAADLRLDRDGVRQKMGVAPEQVADFLALTGDAVDNIPGIVGIGPKSAAQLLQIAGDLQTLLANPEAVAQWPLRGAASLARKLAAGADTARLARRLTEIPSVVPDVPRLPSRPTPVSGAALTEVLRPIGLSVGMAQYLVGFAETGAAMHHDGASDGR